MAWKILLIFFAVWIAAGAAGLLAAHLSGRIRRDYVVTPPEHEISIGSVQKRVSSWADVYRPVMMLRSKNFSPPLLRTLVEVVEQEGAVYFIYYHVWEDEIHPNPFYHRAYRLYRATYYGRPVRDIEYFEVKVNRGSGEIEQLMFETSPGADYNVMLSEHLIAYVTQNADGSFSMRLTRKNGELYKSEAPVKVVQEGQRPLIGAVTWNHLTALVNPLDASYDQRLEVPLDYLTEDEYAGGKFARKSHGTFRTVEKGVSLAAGSLALVVIVVPLGLLTGFSGWLKEKTGGRRRPASM